MTAEERATAMLRAIREYVAARGCLDEGRYTNTIEGFEAARRRLVAAWEELCRLAKS